MTVVPSRSYVESLPADTRPLHEKFNFNNVDPGYLSAVAVIDEVVAVTGLSLRQVLKASGVRPFSYRRWRDRPSQGRGSVAQANRLCDMIQCLDDLTTLLPDLPAWLLEPSRLQMFLAGHFDDLVGVAVTEVHPYTSPLPDYWWYTGDDDCIPEVMETPVVRVPSKIIPIRISARRDARGDVTAIRFDRN